MTTGRLNNGIPQVPPSRNETDLDPFREGLPIQQLREDIIYATNHNQVMLVAGETGSGKTTQVLVFCILYYIHVLVGDLVAND